MIRFYWQDDGRYLVVQDGAIIATLHPTTAPSPFPERMTVGPEAGGMHRLADEVALVPLVDLAAASRLMAEAADYTPPGLADLLRGTRLLFADFVKAA